MSDDVLPGLEFKVDLLIALCAELRQENERLREERQQLLDEREELLENNRRGRLKIAATLERLRALE